MKSKPNDEDIRLIRECIELSRRALEKGDKPFGAIVTLNGKIIARAVNNSKSKVHEHAELVALDKASRKLGKIDLSGCTLYSNCEPCASCSFFIREYHISRLVYSISSLGMGGLSRYPVLTDIGLNRFEPYFGDVPEIVPNVLEEEALEVFEGTGLENYFGSDKKG
jgi:tRNA(adenine34) deaminase